MRLRKIKHKAGKTEIHWTTTVEDTGDETKSELTSFDDPEPEFVTAMEALAADVLEICELPDDYTIGMDVTGLSLSYTDDDRMGATITALKGLEEANSPLVINTPHLPEIDFDDPNPQMTPGMERRVDDLIERAKRFIGGKRAQKDMFDPANEEAAERGPALV